MAVPTETSSATKVVPSSINMIPAYGSLKPYTSGANYPARGSVVYKFPPLSYIAKHDNFGTEAELSVDNDYNAANTKRYTYEKDYEGQPKISDYLSSIPSNFYVCWQRILA